MYVSFIRPKLECADIVWDNCVILLGDKLKIIQTRAARTVSGGII